MVVRLGRSNLGYGSSRTSLSSQDSHGLYSSRQGMTYGGGAFLSYEKMHMQNITIGIDFLNAFCLIFSHRFLWW